MYVIPKMTHIKQTKSMACWYASAQMLVQWKRNTTQTTSSNLLDPSEDIASRKIWEVNSGITNPEILKFARRLGLREIPPMTPSAGAIKNWLCNYGPLWVNGISHIVVIAGVRNTGNDAEVLVYDPAFSIEWRSLSKWYVGKNVDSRDTSGDVRAVFLYCPY